jgi:hypothetical protein
LGIYLRADLDHASLGFPDRFVRSIAFDAGGLDHDFSKGAAD